jgi:hypothetical protein
VAALGARAVLALVGVLLVVASTGAPATAQLGGERIHVTAVMTGVQPDGNPVDVTFDCATPLKFPPGTMHFFGPGDQDVNAQGLTQCTLVAPKPKDATSITIRCDASGDATCVDDRTVRASGQYLVTFTVTAAFPASPPPTTASSLPPAVPPTSAGPGGPPSTTSGAPLPTNAGDPATPGGSSTTGPGATPGGADPQTSAPATPGDAAGTTAGSAPGAGGVSAGGSGTTPAGSSGTAAGAAAGSTNASAASTASPASSGVSPFVVLLVILLVLACVAGGAAAGQRLRRRVTPADAATAEGSVGGPTGGDAATAPTAGDDSRP